MQDKNARISWTPEGGQTNAQGYGMYPVRAFNPFPCILYDSLQGNRIENIKLWKIKRRRKIRKAFY